MPQNIQWSQLADSLLYDRCQWSKASRTSCWRKRSRNFDYRRNEVEQCNSAGAKSMSVLGMIKRTFNTLNKEMFLTLYSTYKEHLEYCIQVWAPYFKKDIVVLEKVQRCAMKLVQCVKNLSYFYLGLYSLSRRRQKDDLIATYKLLRNTEDIDYRKFFIRADTVQLRRHNYKLYKNR